MQVVHLGNQILLVFLGIKRRSILFCLSPRLFFRHQLLHLLKLKELLEFFVLGLIDKKLIRLWLFLNLPPILHGIQAVILLARVGYETVLPCITDSCLF